MDTLREPKKSRHWLVGLGLVAVLALGFGLATTLSKGVGISADETDRSTAVQPRRNREPVRAAPDFAGDARPSRGPQDAPVTVVEFTDYQCPFCARHYQLTYPRLLQEYGDRIQYVVRNFPIVQNHPHAAKVAEAAECAFDQGRFWQYHDRLFENSSGLDNESLKHYARALGLDSSRFDLCLDSGEKSRIVARDLKDGRRYGVRGTPTFFINGRILIGAQPFPVLQEYIERALEETGSE
jgi:protein-disulfide isomerase